MPSKKPPSDLTTNASGEQIRKMPNGEMHLVPAHSGLAKIAAVHEACREPHRELTKVKHVRIAAKKARQTRKGWPADKSPI